MKNKLIIILMLIGIINFSACAANTDKQKTYAFYYCHAEYKYGKDNGVIVAEVNTPAAATDREDILSQYLKGPIDKEHTSPFPEGTVLEFLAVEDGHAEITLSKEFAQLSNIDLTIACACLTMTVSDITGCKIVEISAADSLLNNQRSIVMEANGMLLSDIITSQQDN